VGGPAVTAAPAALELDDIQGIVARGYSRHRGARYSILRINDADRARKWLGSVPVTSASERGPGPALNVALTAGGLAALGLPPGVLTGFAPEFVAGMADPTRSRVLGDVEENAPAGWRWGGPATPPVHLVVMLFAADDAELVSAQSSLSADLSTAGLEEVIGLDTSDHGDREPFGFHDSISQPIVEGLSKSGPSSNTVRSGEFVLGYLNEYGLYTDRPILPASAPGAATLPRDPTGSGGADLGRNGTYVIFRQLRQDVLGFWRYLESVTRNPDGTVNAEAKVHLGARFVGRWPGGAPLVLSPDRDDPALANATDFAYHATDPEGLRCPIGAHVRRSNPRDSLDPDPGTQKSIDVGNRHRLLRRGREYGPLTTPEDLAGDIRGTGVAQDIDDGTEQGLHFVCLSASIARQFEFIQRTWVNNPKFSGLYEDADPLVGSRRAGADCSAIPGTPIRSRLTRLPQFVTVRGGAYFFLPGVKALRYLASLGS
jgi:Dyp-type peroxidase family